GHNPATNHSAANTPGRRSFTRRRTNHWPRGRGRIRAFAAQGHETRRRLTHPADMTRIFKTRRTLLFSLVILALLGGTLLCLPRAGLAQALPAITATPGGDGSQTYSLSIQTLLLLTM